MGNWFTRHFNFCAPESEGSPVADRLLELFYWWMEGLNCHCCVAVRAGILAFGMGMALTGTFTGSPTAIVTGVSVVALVAAIRQATVSGIIKGDHDAEK